MNKIFISPLLPGKIYRTEEKSSCNTRRVGPDALLSDRFILSWTLSVSNQVTLGFAKQEHG